MNIIHTFIQKLSILIDPIFYIRKKRIGKNTYQITKKVKLMVRPGTTDMLIVAEVFTFKQYGIEHHPIKPADIVVDLGAHIGAFTIYAASLAYKGEVYAYEPNPSNFAYLKENIRLNKSRNISIFNSAVSSSTQPIRLYISSSESEHNLYQSETSKYLLVSSLTLNDIFTKNGLSRINYLKLDVEGAEYDILLNTPRKILQLIDTIVFEYHDYLSHGHTHHELVKTLKEAGFTIYYNWPTLIGDIMKMGNILATRIKE
ncbi:MAG: FkbM family methyltransferase [Candidatus Gottesmanbacteria bacterium]